MSGGSRSVNLGGAGATVTWGSGSFVPLGQPFLLGSQSDGGVLNFVNPLAVASGTQSIQVTAGTSGSVDAQLSGAISGTGGLVVSGNGILEFSGSNSFSGGLSVTSGELILAGAQSLKAGSSLVIGSNNGNTSTILPLAIGSPAADQMTSVSPVPEPGNWSLLAAMIGVFAFIQKKHACRSNRRHACLG